MENKQFKKDESQIGVLWEKKSIRGSKYFSGVLDMVETGKINIVIFTNLNRTSEKSPTHIILKSKPREEQKVEKAEELSELDAIGEPEEINTELLPF